MTSLFNYFWSLWIGLIRRETSATSANWATKILRTHLEFWIVYKEELKYLIFAEINQSMKINRCAKRVKFVTFDSLFDSLLFMKLCCITTIATILLLIWLNIVYCYDIVAFTAPWILILAGQSEHFSMFFVRQHIRKYHIELRICNFLSGRINFHVKKSYRIETIHNVDNCIYHFGVAFRFGFVFVALISCK